MDGVKIEIAELNPSKGVNPRIIYDQFRWRKTHEYSGPNTIQIGDVKEPIWWNRPIKTDRAVKKEPDGLYSYNLPYIYTDRLFKSEYNLLVGRGSVPIMLMLKIDEGWEPKQRACAIKLLKTAVWKTAVRLGADKGKLSNPMNDLMYGGKKFMGYECTEHGGWFGAAAVVTLNYSNEKDIFQKLTGEYALRRPICGIQEELGDSFTKEQFTETLIEELEKLLKAL